MSITQNRFVALTQRIKGSQIFKIDSRNKFQDERNSSFESRLRTTKQRDRRGNTTQESTDSTENSISENRNDEIVKLFLKEADEQNSNFKDERICYNCDEKRHIASKCSKSKQKNS